MRQETHLDLKSQQYNPCNQASTCGSALHKWRAMLERDNDETKDEGYYLNDWGFDRDVDTERILFHDFRQENGLPTYRQ